MAYTSNETTPNKHNITNGNNEKGGEELFSNAEQQCFVCVCRPAKEQHNSRKASKRPGEAGGVGSEECGKINPGFRILLVGYSFALPGRENRFTEEHTMPTAKGNGKGSCAAGPMDGEMAQKGTRSIHVRRKRLMSLPAEMKLIFPATHQRAGGSCLLFHFLPSGMRI
ncbi:elongator complex protein 1-like protein [Anopheles sinensis]|uniref:Elongator complex protein 1-like protein n=1 Tax=Anopheles sinensis TaxID=74873 RepID=A0A084VGI1_ANOSI|nr:elongator complex protein 1-like protein [Anopheles sinensis]